MSWANFHTHSNFDDGKVSPLEYVKEALNQNVRILGFSSHNFLPFNVGWTLKRENYKNYCGVIKKLSEKYKDKIEILLGLEVDFLPRYDSFYKEINLSVLDFVIGSVHFVNFFSRDKAWVIDETEEEFERGITEIYKGDIRRAVEDYYELIKRMAQKEKLDIVGHLDLIKMNNKGEKYFSEKEDWYRKAVFETLEIIANKNLILEVNTGGIARGKTDSLYPSLWILEECYRRGISITLCSDAHSPEQITAKFKEAASILNSIGYKELYILTKGKGRACSFSKEGLNI
ncbi:MAG: histidinol-phosphatase [candidate division WOR-3 bacterium]